MASHRRSLPETSFLASLEPVKAVRAGDSFGSVELARRGGCDHRLLRELIEFGLVSQATGKGSAARYFPTHVGQLEAVLRAMNEQGLSRPELRSVVDLDTPRRLRRQACAVERLVGPNNGRERVEEVALDLGLHLSRRGTLPDHLKSSAKKVVAFIAETLRAEADRVESLRQTLVLAMKSQ